MVRTSAQTLALGLASLSACVLAQRTASSSEVASARPAIMIVKCDPFGGEPTQAQHWPLHTGRSLLTVCPALAFT
jgi:hypothetical protein